MTSQLIKVTNAYSGHVTYIVQDRISCFYSAVQSPSDKVTTPERYKHPVKTWVCFVPTEDAMPITEDVKYLLDRHPPV